MVRGNLATEEATKTALIMPFFSLLGYDVFNPMEFIPEFVADVGTKKGEKVDYAIMNEGKPVILIEAKGVDDDLTKHDAQLFRYFTVTDAKFAILTNGIVYKFFTDLEEPNKMDEKPFLLFLSHIEPHHQNDRKTYEGPDGSKEKFKDYPIPKDLNDIDGDYNIHYADYLGCCNSLNVNLGRIRAKLKELKIEDNTVIIYTSDHGCHFKTRNKDLPSGGLDDYKRSFYENTIRVPLIIYGPGFKGGKIINELASLIDIPKTIVELVKGEAPEFMRGESLLKLTNEGLERDEVFIQISESYVGRALRTKSYKYCIIDESKHPYDDINSNIYKECYLYDLTKDPLEKVNLINDKNYNNIKVILRAKMKKYLKDIENLNVTII